jgi:hypothetical protein
MIPKGDYFDISQLEHLFPPEISHWQTDSILLESYLQRTAKTVSNQTPGIANKDYAAGRFNTYWLFYVG